LRRLRRRGHTAKAESENAGEQAQSKYPESTRQGIPMKLENVTVYPGLDVRHGIGSVVKPAIKRQPAATAAK
jgi:hypothetical protein